MVLAEHPFRDLMTLCHRLSRRRELDATQSGLILSVAAAT
jgi:hypothetical protein